MKGLATYPDGCQGVFSTRFQVVAAEVVETFPVPPTIGRVILLAQGAVSGQECNSLRDGLDELVSGGDADLLRAP